MNPEELIAHFALVPHPKAVFTAVRIAAAALFLRLPCRRILPGRAQPGTATFSSCCAKAAIPACIASGQDEIWHFYLGGPCVWLCWGRTALRGKPCWGRTLLDGQHLQYAVPAGFLVRGHAQPRFRLSRAGCVAGFLTPADLKLAAEKELP